MQNLRATPPAFIWRAAATVLLFWMTVASSAHGDSLSPNPRVSALDTLQVVATFENVQAGHVVFGDSDHDGQAEILYRAVNAQANSLTRIIERNPDGHFTLVAEVPGLIPLAIGDIDQDGRTDLVGKAGSFIRVHESADQFSNPSALAWEILSETNVNGRIAIADTDGDGRMEIIHEYFTNTMRMEIYECTGDNSYALRFRFTNPPQPEPGSTGKAWPSSEMTSAQQPRGLLVGDLDGDGRREIVFSDENGVLRVFESFADDSWTQTFIASTGLINPRVVAGAEDANANGLQEIWLAGDDAEAFNRRIFIFEPTIQDTFSCIDTLTTVDGASGGQSGTLAHLDHEDRWRFVWNVRRRLEIYIYQNGQWSIEKIYHDPDPNHFEIRATDLDHNGRDEIVWLGNGLNTESWVLEEPTIPSDTSAGSPRRTIETLRVFPCPTRNSGVVFIEPALAAQVRQWDVFDASGRRVISWRAAGAEAADQRQFPAGHLQPGLYFLRATDSDGVPLATGRVTVVR